ncbi:MAG: hypothetical protein ACRYG4_27595 [Janthinobacterium lividum]
MFTVSSLLWRLVIGGALLAVAAYYKIDIETAQQVAIATLTLMVGATVATLWDF